jgi:predicted amidohydrolase YtcJ
MPLGEFRRRVREAHEVGYQLAIHSNDKWEVENSLSAIEEALDKTPRKNHRHRIEHAHILDRGLIERMRTSGVVISSQPELTLEFEGKHPENDMVVPLRSLLKEGVKVIGGSEATADAYSRAKFPRNYSSPLTGVCFEVTRRTGNGLYVQRDEKVSILDALKVHTINGAYASFDEDVKGTLEVGKLADMVVLSDDPFKVDPEKIKDIKVEKTIIGGRIVYSRE